MNAYDSSAREASDADRLAQWPQQFIQTVRRLHASHSVAAHLIGDAGTVASGGPAHTAIATHLAIASGLMEILNAPTERLARQRLRELNAGWLRAADTDRDDFLHNGRVTSLVRSQLLEGAARELSLI